MLELRPVELDAVYSKRWNESSKDFLNLYKDGVKVSDTLYRTGWCGKNDLKKEYFLLLKYDEAMYSDDIAKKLSDKRHLQARWCILNQEGVEKLIAKPFDSVYLIGGVVCIVEHNYYNIETGELYCSGNTSSASMETSDFVFVHNRWDKDESKCGVLKINKFNGSVELFPQ